MSVERFRQLIAARLGLQFDEKKSTFLADLLGLRAAALRLTIEHYLARFDSDLPSLVPLLTVPETYFFRNVEQFRALAEVVIPARGGVLRMLSAGCASGEEAYTLAIIAREQMREARVRGVDINPDVLARAALGRYTAWSLRETTEEARDKWFQREGSTYVLDESIRRSVVFERKNLSADDDDLWRPQSYDVVFCRNVLMYMTPEHMRAAVVRIANALAPGGYLFMGHSDTLRGVSDVFELCHSHGTFYYRKGTGATMVTDNVAVDNVSWFDAIAASSENIRALHAIDREVPAAWDLSVAVELLQRERFLEALSAVHALPDEARRSADVQIIEAVLLTHKGDLEAARQVCDRLLHMDALNAGAHYVLALCTEAEGDRQSAARHDQVALSLNPSFAMARLHLGLLARRSGERASARRELTEALRLIQAEQAARLVLFGGGFGREALVRLCEAELAQLTERS